MNCDHRGAVGKRLTRKAMLAVSIPNRGNKFFSIFSLIIQNVSNLGEKQKTDFKHLVPSALRDAA